MFDVSQDALLFAEIYRNRKLHNMISKLMNSVPVSEFSTCQFEFAYLTCS